LIGVHRLGRPQIVQKRVTSAVNSLRSRNRPGPIAMEQWPISLPCGFLVCIGSIPKAAAPWSLTSLGEKLIKIAAKVVGHGRYVTFQMAEVAVSRQMLADILMLIARLRVPPAQA